MSDGNHKISAVSLKYRTKKSDSEKPSRVSDLLADVDRRVREYKRNVGSNAWIRRYVDTFDYCTDEEKKFLYRVLVQSWYRK